MICPNQKWLVSTLQQMAPLLQSQFNCKKFSVANIIVTLWRGKSPREEGTGMKFVVRGGTLGKNCPYARNRGIHVHHKLEGWVWQGEYWSRGETALEFLEGNFSLRCPGKWGCNAAVISYKLPINICKTQESLQLP